ncbi:uncharacterized protein isoform X1 [Choristoneura fumiferana]|uniref:uncharacterized protein isoform X1 n=1 Tax=Choristoneura fumiferana TaxID=7141 RepID=UPI003D15C142
MADQYTVDLLSKWGCTDLIDTFRDARIDAVALGLLKENDISSIPLIGDRVKFQANLSMWKADNQSVIVGDDDLLETHWCSRPSEGLLDVLYLPYLTFFKTAKPEHIKIDKN